MAFTSVLSIGGRTGSRGPRGDQKSVRIVVYNSSSVKRNAKRAISFIIGEEICKELRWMVGDYLDIQVDTESGLGKLVRVPEGKIRGNKLLCASSGQRASLVGVISRSVFRFSASPEMIRVFFPHDTEPYLAENVVVKAEGLLFSIPRKNKN